MNDLKSLSLNSLFVLRVTATYNNLLFAQFDRAMRWRGDSIVPLKPMRKHGRQHNLARPIASQKVSRAVCIRRL